MLSFYLDIGAAMSLKFSTYGVIPPVVPTQICQNHPNLSNHSKLSNCPNVTSLQRIPPKTVMAPGCGTFSGDFELKGGSAVGTKTWEDTHWSCRHFTMSHELSCSFIPLVCHAYLCAHSYIVISPCFIDGAMPWVSLFHCCILFYCHMSLVTLLSPHILHTSLLLAIRHSITLSLRQSYSGLLPWASHLRLSTSVSIRPSTNITKSIAALCKLDSLYSL